MLPISMKNFVVPVAVILMLSGAYSGALAQNALSEKTEAPLQGRAWQSANQAYKFYNSGRYEQAIFRVQEAIRLRPDVLRLRMLLIFSLQKLGRNKEALQAIDSAKLSGFSTTELDAAKNNLKASSTVDNIQKTEGYQRGFPYAQKAYAEYQDKKYLDSERHAEQAFKLDVTQGEWVLLWVSALEAQEKYQAAIEAIDISIDLGAPNKSDLLGRRQSMQRLLAIPYAEKAYLSDDPAEAVQAARQAVSIAPSVTSHRLLLITALQRNSQFKEAEAAATAALEQDEENTSALVMRAYLRQLSGNSVGSDADFDRALEQDWMDEDNLKNIRLIAADASIVGGNLDRSYQLLGPLNAADAPVAKRLRITQAGLKTLGSATQENYPPPIQDCRNTPYGTVCDLLPSDAQGETFSAKAYAAYGRQAYQEAIGYAKDALAQEPNSITMQRLLTTTLAVGNRDQQREALNRITQDLSEHSSDADLLMQRSYLYLNLNQPALALADIRVARITGKAPATAIVSEGFAQAADGDKLGAIQTLKSAVDMAEENLIQLTEEERWNTRSAISGFDREWGATVAVGYRGARSAGAVGGTPIVVPGDAVFSTAELYWRPWNFLNSATRTFEVYGRLTNTLHTGTGKTVAQEIPDPCNPGSSIAVNGALNGGGRSGFPTSIGALGVRLTPDATWGLTLGLERQFLLGSATRRGSFTPSSQSNQCALQKADMDARYTTDMGDGGWMAYVSYGYYFGTERKIKETNWLTVEAYAQAGWAWQSMHARFAGINRTTGAETFHGSGRYKRDQGFASAEVRVGRSFRMDEISDRLVFFPHVVVGIDWLKTRDRVSGVQGNPTSLAAAISDSALSNDGSWASSVGLGVGARYWFREDKYHTPRSYLDWTVQYRANVGGGQADRAKGVYMNLTLSY